MDSIFYTLVVAYRWITDHLSEWCKDVDWELVQFVVFLVFMGITFLLAVISLILLLRDYLRDRRDASKKDYPDWWV